MHTLAVMVPETNDEYPIFVCVCGETFVFGDPTYTPGHELFAGHLKKKNRHFFNPQPFIMLPDLASAIPVEDESTIKPNSWLQRMFGRSNNS